MSDELFGEAVDRVAFSDGGEVDFEAIDDLAERWRVAADLQFFMTDEFFSGENHRVVGRDEIGR